MKKLLISFLLALSLTACGESEKNTTAENIKPIFKIGIATPLSGAIHKEAGEMQKAMIWLANKKKDSIFNYELIFEDTAGQATKGISAAKKMLYSDNVNAIISHLSAISKVVSPLATQKNVLHIGTVLDANLEDNPTSFTFWTTAERKAKKYVEYLKDNKFSDIGVLVLNFATTEKLYEALEEVALKEGIKLTKYEFMPNQRDFTLDLLKIKDAGHQQITFLLYPPTLEILYKQYKQQGINLPVSTIECFAVANNIQDFEDIVYVDTYSGDPKKIEEIRIGANTQGTYAFAQLADILDVIDKVASKFYQRHKRIPNGQEMTNMLIELKSFQGLSGNVEIGFDRKIQPKAVLLYLKNGKPVIVKE